MADEIMVDVAKFDKILGRMLSAKPITKAEISTRVQTEGVAKRDAAFARYKQRKAAKKIGL